MFGSFESHYFTFQIIGDIVVAKCLMANLSDEENIEAVGHELLTMIGKYECRRLILDLSEVDYMTSSMVGKMIRVHRQLHRDGGKVVLCNISSTVDDILRTSHLLSYFNTAKTPTEAAGLFDDVSEEDDAEDEDPSAQDTVDEI